LDYKDIKDASLLRVYGREIEPLGKRRWKKRGVTLGRKTWRRIKVTVLKSKSRPSGFGHPGCLEKARRRHRKRGPSRSWLTTS
jgi:hypothetical protein